MDNINIWFARNKDGDIVTIDKINDNNRYEEYSCPICESKLIAKLGEKNAHHLAHKDASKCSRETQIHFFVKNELLKQGDKFTVRLDDESKEFVCKEILIEQEYETEFGTYKPDITIMTEDDKTIYFEVAHTNKKKIEDYLDIWIELNNIVVEIETKEMIEGKIIKEFKAKFYEGKCFNIKQEDKEYYELVGKIKLNDTEYPKEQVEKLNWFWKDINRYLLREFEISEISDLIQAIEDKELREIVVSILRKSRCTGIMEDYIDYNIKCTEKHLNSYNEEYRFECKITRLVHERIFMGCDIEMFYKEIYCGKGFCVYNFDSFENILECNKNKILYGKLKYLILDKLPECKDIKYFNNSYGESIYFSNTYIKLENEKNAYNTVNNLINKKLEKNKIEIENMNTLENNKLWLKDLRDITYDYREIGNYISIYYGCGSHVISFNNVTFSNEEILNTKLIIEKRISNIKTYNYLQKKLYNVIDKINGNPFKFKVALPIVKKCDDNYEDVQISVDITNRHIYNETIFDKPYKISETNLDTILIEVENSINNTKYKYECVYNALNEFKSNIYNTKNEYEIEVFPSYCIIYNLELDRVDSIFKYSDINNVKNLLKRKMFKKCLIENINFYYELNIAKDVISKLEKRYREHVKGIWNFRCKNENMFINGKKVFEVNYSDLDSKEKLQSYLNNEISNYLRELRYGTKGVK